MMSSAAFPATRLTRFAATALGSQGVPEADAELTARSLVQADQRRVHSHGLLRLPLYVEALREGGITSAPQLRFLRDHGASSVLDADSGLGQVAMQAAVERAAERAGTYGVAAVAVQNSTHYGAGSFWTDQLAAQGIAAFLSSTTGPVVATHGGSSPVLGTNPITLSAPAKDEDPLTLDMATSAGAFGKVVAADQAGEPIPEGWAVDATGNPTTDAAAARRGALLPFGGHKGAGLAVLLEALSAAFTDADFAHQRVDIWNDPSSRMNNGHLLIALDTAAFAGREESATKVSALKYTLAGSGDNVLLPGQPEYEAGRRQAESVLLPADTARGLTELAEQLNLADPAQGQDRGGTA